jgi:hypothetical protein
VRDTNSAPSTAARLRFLAKLDAEAVLKLIHEGIDAK